MGKKWAKWRSIPQEELLASARRHHHITDWAASDPIAYWAGRNTSPEFYAACTVHMTAKSNPWNTPYVIYAFEFADRRVYVGLTFRPSTRQNGRLTSAVGDAVYEHHKVCRQHQYRLVQEGIIGSSAAAKAERGWIERYRLDGWVILNRSAGGEIGGAAPLRISNSAVLEDAAKYATRGAWKTGNLPYYELARRRGVLVEATAHMPKLVRNKQSQETKLKIKTALLGHPVSQAAREKRSSTWKLWRVRSGRPPLAHQTTP